MTHKKILKYILCSAFAIVGLVYAPRLAFASANLIRNPGAETIDLRGWSLTNAGDNGWSISSGAYAHGGQYSFIGSYNLDTMSQEIDLTGWGYTGAALDAQPSITATAYVAGVPPNASDAYRMVVELRNSSHAVITSYDTGTQAAAGDHVWTQLTHTFTSYGAGVRYVYIRLESNDAEFWAGNYGAVFDDVSVTIGGAGPTLAITTPGSGQTVSTWAPAVNWGTSTACLYSYDDYTYTAVSCAANGSDIPQTTTSLNPTLYIVGIDAAGNSSTASSTFTQTAANTLNFGLVNYWKFDETTAGTCAGNKDACDSSGNANHGTYSGPPTPSTTTAPVRFTDTRSLSFNGTNNYVTVTRSVADDFTICAWIKTATAGNTTNHWQTAPIYDAEVSGLASDFGFGVDSNGRLAYGNGGLYDATVNGATSVINNQWRHACVTRAEASGQVKLYVDGVLDASGTTHTAKLNASTNARIGYGLDGVAAKYFNGLIDDVRVYQRVLSLSEVGILAQGYDRVAYTAPVIVLLGSSPVEVNVGATYTELGATATDDLDGTLTGSLVVTNPVNTSVVGTYHVVYNVTDSSGNAAVPVAREVRVVGGGLSLPPIAYSAPAMPTGGFQFVVNNNAPVVNSPVLHITSNAGPDIKSIALSTTSDFANVGQMPYTPTLEWNLCGQSASCPDGQYTVYAKLYTVWGQPSKVESFNVKLQQSASKVLGAVTATVAESQNILPVFTKTLTRGSRGIEVTRLQTLLAKDASVYPEGQVTGYYGPATVRAVQRFQVKYAIAKPGSAGYGVVGPATRLKLNELHGK